MDYDRLCDVLIEDECVVDILISKMLESDSLRTKLQDKLQEYSNLQQISNEEYNSTTDSSSTICQEWRERITLDMEQLDRQRIEEEEKERIKRIAKDEAERNMTRAEYIKRIKFEMRKRNPNIKFNDEL